MLRSAEHLVHKYGIPLFLWEKYRTGKNRHLLTHALLTFLEAPGPAW
ncbi:MAG TPA: hypothetical protein VGT06_05460 [Candidatus Methylomirabilis sp.]|jgi:hypothetical protein|nr:hypothetical protein [Candidatus Methylomirabilis sp.]